MKKKFKKLFEIELKELLKLPIIKLAQEKLKFESRPELRNLGLTERQAFIGLLINNAVFK